MSSSLVQFLRLVLRLAPPLLWWALGGAGVGVLSEMFWQELWPHTPAAEKLSAVFITVCLLSLPWTVACTAWRLADAVESFFWKAVWRFTAVAGFASALAVSLGGGLLALFVF